MPRLKTVVIIDYRLVLIGNIIQRWDSYAGEVSVFRVTSYDDGQRYAVYYEDEGRILCSDLDPRYRVHRCDQVVSRGQWCVGTETMLRDFELRRRPP